MCIDSHKSKMFYSKRRAIIYPLDVPDTVEYSVYRANLEYGSKRNLGKIAVLELGCGTGRYFHLLSNVSTLVGVDISSAMLERANENLQTMSALSGCTRLINNDFVNLQLHELFDFIYSIGTLGEYCKFNSEIISKIIGWLKPSGFLFFTIVDADSYTIQYRQGIKDSFKKIINTVLEILPEHYRVTIGHRFLDTKDWKHLFMTKAQVEEVLENCSDNITYEISSARDAKHVHHICRVWLSNSPKKVSK